MYENIVAAAFSHLSRTHPIRRDIAAENDFYERYAHPYPRWFVSLRRVTDRHKMSKGGIAAAPEIGSSLSGGAGEDQNSDRCRARQIYWAMPERCGSRFSAPPGSPSL
ncbi:hypothetical protein [Neorhizobium galegae]|uniref:hypothetical protein n=1 Tax=Neorhizobium galegae TaxID=399 RepID=UPI00062102D5|nr:hypothetical protein [Neorhizobium galegae]CDZ28456.1 Hypothetical protein NGAL_HAMBI490_33150 [Neorhizobium galegae bv. officinalis]KAA9385963.1 hypothetical protein F4V88_05500 [Neorhizobium galegae]KAB1113610.1 hypothetical protein F4V89_12945 [Neorhizobium galegae]MCM2496568.1 hypothetical protein [Neorhizobium galegae]MCQ1764145.1 hypothetical protein [Neorhizobium galegae]